MCRACNRHVRNTYILVVKYERKLLVCTHWHRWQDNIKMNLKEIGFDGVHLTHLGQDRNL
jgi:hypothetical protein